MVPADWGWGHSNKTFLAAVVVVGGHPVSSWRHNDGVRRGEGGARRPSYPTGEEDGSVSSSDDVDGDDDKGKSLVFVSELTPLFTGAGHHPLCACKLAVIPVVDNDNVVEVDDDEHDDDGRVNCRCLTTRLLPRKLSNDDSIHTLTAMQDMEIRCHSVNGVIHRPPGHCIIRLSTTKVVSEREEAGLALCPHLVPGF